MSYKDRKLNYLKCIIIVEGETEAEFFNMIKRAKRLGNIEIQYKKKSSIQISSILAYLNTRKFTDSGILKNDFKNIKLGKDGIPEDCKIYTVLDKDETSDKLFQDYKNGIMFKAHKFSSIICPVYSIRDFDDILVKVGIYPKKPSNKDKTSYVSKYVTQDIFRNDASYNKLIADLELIDKTNLSSLLKYLRSIEK